MSVKKLLSLDLRVPAYQRPYRWSTKSVADLLGDMSEAMGEHGDRRATRYRIGTVILHKNAADGCFDIVDGQQRLLSLTLLMLCLNEGADFPLLVKSHFSDRETLRNMRANHAFMLDWIGYQPADWRARALEALSGTFEAVVITVGDIEEAFQLFDSQNTRGRALDPHDLLKAYHLRAMRERPYEMRHVVTRWEEFSSDEVREMFARYLFPTLSWELKEKARPFTAREIDAYKGVGADSGYSYAERARRAAPSFQIGEPFIEGEDFFLMAEHYLRMRKDIFLELRDNLELRPIRDELSAELRDDPVFKPVREELPKEAPSAGHRHACKLFLCALFAYYDRFHNFDVRAVRKLFSWAMMIRVDMQALGFGTINKYAIGEGNDRYTNVVPMFARIARARHHTDIADIVINTRSKADPNTFNTERRELSEILGSWSKGGAR